MKTCEQVIEENVNNLANYYYERYRISRAEFITTPKERVNTRKLYREEMLTWKEVIEVDVGAALFCKECWQTWSEPSHSRGILKIEYEGKTQTLKEWAEDLGISEILMYNYIVDRQWPMEIMIKHLENKRKE